MTTEHTIKAIGSLLLSISLAACTSSRAPVEQRWPAPSGAPPAAQSAPPQDQQTGQQQTQVQVIGLGDDGGARTPQPGVRGSWSEPTPPVPGVAAQRGSPAAAASSAAGGATTSSRGANPAVVALLNRANRDAAAGRHGASAASLERAIKIEPGNAWLWHRLAQTRLKQDQPGEAASLAARSNSLAVNDNALRALNWRLIARVHRLRGESVAAQAAQRKAEDLERGSS